MAGKSPRPPPQYGAYLASVRERLGITRAELAERGELLYNTVLRNENGSPDRSVKGSAQVRDALIKLGARDVAPVPTNDDWQPPDEVPPSVSTLAPIAEKFRRNLIRFREGANLDAHSLSYMARISVEQYRRYEDGADELRLADIETLATALGIDPGAFFADPSAPLPKLEPAREYWLGGPATEDLSDADRAEIDRIMEPFVRALHERRARREQARGTKRK